MPILGEGSGGDRDCRPAQLSAEAAIESRVHIVGPGRASRPRKSHQVVVTRGRNCATHASKYWEMKSERCCARSA